MLPNSAWIASRKRRQRQKWALFVGSILACFAVLALGIYASYDPQKQGAGDILATIATVGLGLAGLLLVVLWCLFWLAVLVGYILLPFVAIGIWHNTRRSERYARPPLPPPTLR